jgi:hypothetical protein
LDCQSASLLSQLPFALRASVVELQWLLVELPLCDLGLPTSPQSFAQRQLWILRWGNALTVLSTSVLGSRTLLNTVVVRDEGIFACRCSMLSFTWSAVTAMRAHGLVLVCFIYPQAYYCSGNGFQVYSVSLGINLALAFPFSLLVERPMMDLRAQCGCARKREASNFCGSTTSSKGGSKRSSSGSGSTSNSSSRNIGSGQLKSGSSLSSSHQVSAYVLSSTSSQGQVSAVGVPRKVLVLQGGGREGGGEVLFSGHARQTYGAAPEDNPFR